METNIDGGAETGAIWQMYKVIYEWIDLNSVSFVQSKIIDLNLKFYIRRKERIMYQQSNHIQ